MQTKTCCVTGHRDLPQKEINCVKAAVAGLVALKSPEQVAAARGKTVEEILG